MNTFNSFTNAIRSFGNYIISVIYSYNFPALDPSLVLYYPLDVSGSRNTFANYASQLPVYDASLSTGAMITTSKDTFINGVGDLSLNNTMGSIATNYVTSNKSFILNPSGGLSISCWFSCSGELGKKGTLISLYQDSIYSSIELDIVGSTLFSGYYIAPNVLASVTPITSNDGTSYIYTFNNSGNIKFNNFKNPTITVILIGGGGGGGGANHNSGAYGGGGGGGGGVGYGTIIMPSIFTTTLTITIGSGGISGVSINDNTRGNNSTLTNGGVINEIAYGGGGGQMANQYYAGVTFNTNCGSGGGGCGFGFDINGAVSPAGTASKGTGSLTYHGYNGGGGAPRNSGGGGGGGAGSVGSSSVNSTAAGGSGGNSITFTTVGNTFGPYSGGGTGGTANGSNANGNTPINKGYGGDGGNTATGNGGAGASGVCIIIVPISQVS